jgi:holo-[acyl-carrier protein] synthase
MKIINQGIDLIECRRVREVWQRHGDRFTERVLTKAELAYVRRHRDPVPRIAGRFAAKEAIVKALGTGFRGKITWRDMEILNDALGQPTVTLTGECEHVAAELGITRILVSITHTENYAAATAIAIADE